ncbi:hypothetical protein Cni_G29449 [Canna indica]|uniref:Isopenicillin N synthase-like Fe(2+) 2OG dioxygenase domain-containing protein n=1 Tax=Canna indica TaxID=4628 RepID=A0AAQ3L556_9LILI|nr:hypothetical protein Cni_G29449 [Canna indica]
METTTAAILEPLELRFSDLLLLSSTAPPHSSPLAPAELSRLQSLSAAVMHALGPSGPGLLTVTGVPRAPGLRGALLPFARKLALLGRKDLARVLKEHGLGSDVPIKNLDRNVSSFALQLKYTEGLVSDSSSNLTSTEENSHAEGNPVVSFANFDAMEFKNLGHTFKELGLCMMELGLRLAQICDKATDCKELEESIMDGSAKGRLIHYHSMLDNIIMKEANRRRKGSKKRDGRSNFVPSPSNERLTSEELVTKSGRETLPEQTSFTQYYPRNRDFTGRMSKTALSNLWQQWHYDYGIFTVLTSPSFMFSCQAEGCSHISCCQECSSPDGHTYLQLLDIKKNKIYVVKTPPDSFIIQVGEAADILTRGKLRSTLHSVSRPFDTENLSREIFVVFLLPAWSKVLSYSGYPFYDESWDQDKSVVRNDISASYEKEDISFCADSHQLMQEIIAKIPPLSIRYRDGMTFAEFSRETTKQYYSSSGTQSIR